VSSYPSSRERVENYLEELVEDEGTVFIRSRRIGRALDLGPRQVGIHLSRLEDDDEARVDVEKWSRSRGAWKWRVTDEEPS